MDPGQGLWSNFQLGWLIQNNTAFSAASSTLLVASRSEFLPNWGVTAESTLGTWNLVDGGEDGACSGGLAEATPRLVVEAEG